MTSGASACDEPDDRTSGTGPPSVGPVTLPGVHTQRGRVRLLLSSAVALVVVAALGPALPSVAQGSSDDYFVSAFGDPMDFSNQEDLVINTNEAMFTGNAANKSISGGQLHFDSVGATTFDPVWAGFPTGIPHGREGNRVPIDASRYGRLVIRMNAPEGVPAAATWFSCVDQTPACQGGTAFTTHAGWNTYDLPLNNTMGLPTSWSGRTVGLRLILNGAGHFDVDWIRLAPAGAGDVQEIVGGPMVDLLPNGKLDFATAAGNPWDMDGPGDVRQLVGLRAGTTFAGNTVSGCTVGTASGQFPGLVMSLPAGPIDANRFKTLTFEYSYDGAFSVKPVAGGGRFARVFWTDATGRHPTQSIALYPNEHIVSVRLDDPAAVSPGVEHGVRTGKPWGGTVNEFRLNPNDSKDSACFRIGRVWLTADEPAGATIAPVVAPVVAPVTNAPVTNAPVTNVPGTVRPTAKATKTTKRAVRTTKKRATTKKR